MNLTAINEDDFRDLRRLPNYSRFPGDGLGLNSSLAQAALNGQANIATSYEQFRHIIQIMDLTTSGDILAWDNVTGAEPLYRTFELAAIAPDLFDITYYSIEPNFEENYRRHLLGARNQLGIPPTVPIRPDLGGRAGAIPSFSIQAQMAKAHNAQIGNQTANLHSEEAFYFVRDRQNLLTGWVPGLEYGEYHTFPADRFGHCTQTDDEQEVKNPGSCINGGRTGYSVKLVSRDLLLYRTTPIGGNDEASGPIENPPPLNLGW